MQSDVMQHLQYTVCHQEYEKLNRITSVLIYIIQHQTISLYLLQVLQQFTTRYFVQKIKVKILNTTISVSCTLNPM